MASAGRTLSSVALGVVMLAAFACVDGDVERSSTCLALDALGDGIGAYESLLVWPGITAAPLRAATEALEADVARVVEAAGTDAAVTGIVPGFRQVAAAVDDTVPPLLAEGRPGEPVQMAASFISIELQPLAEAHGRALQERC